MSRPRNAKPTYRFQKARGKAIVTYYRDGQRKSILLPGAYNSPESLAEYKRICEILDADGLPRPCDSSPSPLVVLTVAELIERYWEHVQRYYRRIDGSATQEVSSMMYTLRPVNFICGEKLVGHFGARDLKAVRELMIHGYQHPQYGQQSPLCRAEINKRIKRIRRMVKWGVEEEIVAADVLVRLQAVAPLKRGRTAAHESPDVKPVARAVVEETLPILRPMHRDMIMLQLETRMRTGELVTLRRCDINTAGKVWLYQPAQHKTLHHGHDRIIAIGPRAQEIIRRHLTTKTDAAIFSPAVLMEERRQAMRANRKTGVQPSQANRAKVKRKRPPGNQYTVQSYDRAIAKAIERHNKGKPDCEHIPHWAPNQLRHLRALEVKREFGLDTARAVLGHKQPCITEMYAGVDTATAAAAMGKIG